MVTESGQLIRTRAGEFREIGRNTQGVRATRLGEGDRLVCAARVLPTDADDGVQQQLDVEPEAPEESDLSDRSDVSDVSDDQDSSEE